LQMSRGRGGAATYWYVGEGGGATVRYFIRDGDADRVAAMDSGRVAQCFRLLPWRGAEQELPQIYFTEPIARAELDGVMARRSVKL
jgi:hypothetical protein